MKENQVIYYTVQGVPFSIEESAIEHAKSVNAKVYRRVTSSKEKIEMLNEQLRFLD